MLNETFSVIFTHHETRKDANASFMLWERNLWLCLLLVSHTTDDLVFIWLPEDKVPLAVDAGIELPQLELVSNYTGDCTSVYSTGTDFNYISKSWSKPNTFLRKKIT